MSGIAGLVRLGGQRANIADVHKMASRMTHRGPDGARAWATGSAALVHLKLSVTPQSLRESQPTVDATSGIVVVADLRLDGREDLAHRLGMERHVVNSFDGPTDTDLLTKAFLKWGQAAPEYLDGDFAFAVWDPRDRTMFAARDPFGTRTLYYYYAPGDLLAFSSEAKALLALPEVPDGINKERLAQFLSGKRISVDLSIFESLHVLPAAHALIGSTSGFRSWKYYELRAAAGLGMLKGQEGVDAFRYYFETSVRDRVRSAFPVGAQLSGGLDSSSIVAVAREAVADQGLDPLHTFTLTFDETQETDERPYAEKVIQQGGVIPHFISADALSPLGNLHEIYGTLDDNLVGGTQHQGWALLIAARDAGVRIVLDGFDGDTVVDHGTLFLREKADLGDWLAFAKMSRSVNERYLTADHLQDFERTLTTYEGVFGQYGWPALVDLASYGSRWKFLLSLRKAARDAGVHPRDAIHRLWRRFLRPRQTNLRTRQASELRRQPDIPTFIDRQFANRVGLNLEPETSSRYSSVDCVVPLRERQREALSSPLFLGALQAPAHLAASLGFDLAHPFFDRRLVELCLALPPELSFSDGWTRFVLRKSMDARLPRSVAWRIGKARMSPAFERALRVHDSYRLQEIAQNPGWLSDYIDVDAFRNYAKPGRSLTEREQTHLAWIATAIWWLQRQWPDGPDRPSIYGSGR